mmetsp:Transcript_23718/g.78795  ORF Transcript_23718/g.78795 Transcript_23718/m.78795 type:complete len:258 (-) Transcript_23718:55-828(-)
MSAWLRRRERGSSTRCGVENVACASGRARARSSIATATSPVAFQPRAVRTLPESDSALASTPCEPSDKCMSRLRSELDGGPRRRKGSRLPPTRHCTAAAATRAAAHKLATGAAMMATGGREKTATHALADEAQTVASDIRTSSKCHTCTDGARVTRTGSDQACGRLPAAATTSRKRVADASSGSGESAVGPSSARRASSSGGGQPVPQPGSCKPGPMASGESSLAPSGRGQEPAGPTPLSKASCASGRGVGSNTRPS